MYHFVPLLREISMCKARFLTLDEMTSESPK